MFAWVFFHDLNSQITKCARDDQLGVWGENFRGAGPQEARINDLLKSMGWNVAPWWDFFGWFQNARISAVTIVLNEAIDTAKLKALPNFVEKIKTVSEEALLNLVDFRFYDQKEIELVGRFVEASKNNKTIKLNQFSSWKEFEGLAEGYLLKRDYRVSMLADQLSAKSAYLAQNGYPKMLECISECILDLEEMDQSKLEEMVQRAEKGEDVSEAAPLVQTFFLFKTGLVDQSFMSDQVFTLLKRFAASSGLATTLSGSLNQKFDVEFQRKEALRLQTKTQPKKMKDVRRGLIGDYTTAAFNLNGEKVVLPRIPTKETEEEMLAGIKILSEQLSRLAINDKRLRLRLQGIAYQTVESIATISLYKLFSENFVLQVGKSLFEKRNVMFERTGDQVKVRYEYIAPFVLGHRDDLTFFGQCRSVHTYTISNTNSKGWAVTDVQFEPLEVLLAPEDANLERRQKELPVANVAAELS